MDEEVGSSKPRGDVRHAAEQMYRNLQLAGKLSELGPLWAFTEHDELGRRVAAANVGQGSNSAVQAFLRLEPANGEQHACARSDMICGVRSPRGRQVVQTVVDDLDLVCGQADPFHLEARQRIGDRNHLGGSVRQRALDEAKRSRAERVVVVLRGDESTGSQRSVDVGMHEVRVYEICIPRFSPDAQRQPWIDVARRGNAHVRHGQRFVERIRRARRVVEPEEAHVDSACGQRGQERQKMALGAADAPDPVDVQDLHGSLRHRRASTHSIAPAPRSAIRKSVAMR